MKNLALTIRTYKFEFGCVSSPLAVDLGDSAYYREKGLAVQGL